MLCVCVHVHAGVPVSVRDIFDICLMSVQRILYHVWVRTFAVMFVVL